MAWNEPGKGQDPWGGGPNKGDGPPDLDEVWKQFRQRFGGGRTGNGGAGGSGMGGRGVVLIVLAALTIWGFSGFYTVDDAERAVILQFGKYHSTQGAGLHWHIPTPVQKAEIVNVDGIRNETERAQMLTQDENIVDLEIAVQYKVSSPEDYLFKLRQPEETLHDALRSAVRETVGKENMDFILTEGRDQIELRTRDILQEALDSYSSGLMVTEVNLKDAQPPEAVQDAFADAIRAREDEERLQNEAQAYANDILPKARGSAARQVAEANAYRERVVAEAEGEAVRFSLLREEYEQAPEVTRKRLYLDAMQSVLGNTSKIVVDSEAGNQMLYLPLDQLIKRQSSALESLSPDMTIRDTNARNKRSSGNRSASDARSRSRN